MIKLSSNAKYLGIIHELVNRISENSSDNEGLLTQPGHYPPVTLAYTSQLVNRISENSSDNEGLLTEPGHYPPVTLAYTSQLVNRISENSSDNEGLLTEPGHYPPVTLAYTSQLVNRISENSSDNEGLLTEHVHYPPVTLGNRPCIKEFPLAHFLRYCFNLKCKCFEFEKKNMQIVVSSLPNVHSHTCTSTALTKSVHDLV